MGDNPGDQEDFCHGIVGNIPVEFHSADLRSFFSQFIESNGFECFHFRHRPEVRISTGSNTDQATRGKSCCCVVRLSRQQMSHFIKMYDGQIWVDRTKKCFPQKAVISRIKVGDHGKGSKYTELQYQTRKEKKQCCSEKVEFSRTDLEKLPELHPPPMMPNGNVGTPTPVFLELIRCCKLPPKIVSKLGLTFPKNGSRKKYVNVPFDYNLLKGRKTGVIDGHDVKKVTDTDNNSGQGGVTDSNCPRSASQEGALLNQESLELTANSTKTVSDDVLRTGQTGINEHATTGASPDGHLASSNDLKTDKTSWPNSPVNAEDQDLLKTGKASRKRKDSPEKNEKPELTESDNQAKGESVIEPEDWERHEALHNDVDNQSRTRERLFEEEIELKWEKGGSGLVFYTDAAYWRQQEEGDMDEEMADDWDVDMGVYDEPGGGDKDSRDLLQMRVEEQWRQGNEVDPNRIGGFEKFTKGFGSRLMRQQGWQEGRGLGTSQVGIAEPVSAEGQTPYSKRGLGYFGEKLERNVHIKRPRADREVMISTVYDEPDERGTNLFQSQGPYILTYRDNVEFVPAKETK